MTQRPLSPHLQIYRLPLTALLSISHRLTGVLLVLGLALMALLLAAAAAGAEWFDPLLAALGSTPGRVLVGGGLFALYFHACHGIRHLLWDGGWGFDQSRLWLYSLAELAVAGLLTALTLLLGGAPDAPPMP